MTRKIIFLLTGLFIFANLGFSQKLKDKIIQVPYVSLPSKKLPASFSTYSVKVNGGAFNYSNRDPFSTAKSIRMDGFKRLTGMGSDFGHLRVYATASTPYIGAVTPAPKPPLPKIKMGRRPGQQDTGMSSPSRHTLLIR